MQILQSIDAMRRLCKAARRGGVETPDRTVGFVPTMGALHEGHLSLVRTARASCDCVAASIFVNPLQFSPSEDFTSYPRTFDNDCAMLESEGVDLLFAPAPETMYPAEMETVVEVPEIGSRLDGVSRPEHFRGVATVVTKLFHIVQPDRAFFGQKDAAQVAVLRAMVRDLNFDVEIIVCPTVRELDGLAISSRNRKLSASERKQASALARSLQHLERAFAAGESSATVLRETLRRELQTAEGLRLDYAEIVDPLSLKPVSEIGADEDAGTLVAVAAWVGDTRLIDNIVLCSQRAKTGQKGQAA